MDRNTRFARMAPHVNLTELHGPISTETIPAAVMFAASMVPNVLYVSHSELGGGYGHIQRT